jgi:hypothetical protein
MVFSTASALLALPHLQKGRILRVPGKKWKRSDHNLTDQDNNRSFSAGF